MQGHLHAGRHRLIGYGRTIAEIAEWGLATASRQHDIVRRSSARLRNMGSQHTQDSEPLGFVDKG
jgi:predicted Fe-S protein YdhL (DUF1289 family)